MSHQISLLFVPLVNYRFRKSVSKITVWMIIFINVKSFLAMKILLLYFCFSDDDTFLVTWQASENTILDLLPLRRLPVSESHFEQGRSRQPVTLLKKRLGQIFSSEFCEIFKNTFLYGTLLVVAYYHFYLSCIVNPF